MSLVVSAQECQEAVEHLQNLIRINTTNPPGHEIAACQYLAAVLKKENIPFTILESAPGRANLVARLVGDQTQKPLLLTSHLDVVPAEKEFWQEDPFGGVIKDGFIWGRGAVDMKQMTAMELAVFLKAHREKLPLKRDLILAAVADEEAGCEHGSKFLVTHHPELIRAEYALNEVGGFSLTIDQHVFYPIGVAEKGLCWFKIIARGKTGHGSMPHDQQALPHLCLATHAITHQDLPFHNTPLVTEFVNELAKKQPFPKNLILKGTTKKMFSRFILKYLFPNAAKAKNFRNMFHNLATPTVFRAGSKENVIPSSAEVIVDGRILPGQTIQSFLQEVQKLIGQGFEIEVLQAEEPNQTDFDNDFFNTLKTSLVSLDPQAIPVPFLIPGFTDAKHYAKLGIKCYGFAPTKLPADLNFGELYHGHNERIPVTAIEFGVKTLWDVILKTCV